MEQSYAIVQDGIVVNVVVWDGVQHYDPGDGLELVALPYDEDEDGKRRYTAGIGWTYKPKATKNKWLDNRPVEDD